MSAVQEPDLANPNGAWAGPSRRDAGELMGRTECNRIVNFDGGPNAARLVGQMLDVKITRAYPHSLRGEVLVTDDARAA